MKGDSEELLEVWRGDYTCSYEHTLYLRYVLVDHKFNDEHRFYTSKVQIFYGWKEDKEDWRDTDISEYYKQAAEHVAIKLLEMRQVHE